MKSRCTIAALILTVSGCVAEDGFLITILDSPARDAQCVFPANSVQFRSSGILDASFGEPFVLGVTLISNLIDEDTETRTCAGSGDACVEPKNNVTLIGFDTCFFRGADLPADIDQTDISSGRLLDCDNLGAGQNRFVPSAGTLVPDTVAVQAIQVLNRADVEALYGGLDIDAIPFGQNYVDANGNNRMSFNLEDPSDLATRSTAWGSFPAAREDPVLVQVRARGKLPTGRAIKSNWYTFGVTVGLGSVLDGCLDPIETLCDCASGPCIESTGLCPDGSACAVGFEGTEPELTGCAPWEGDGTIACLPFTTCAETN